MRNLVFGHTVSKLLGVREGLSQYLRENAFDASEYVSDTFALYVFGQKFFFPNSATRKKAIPLHDLHHVATGYGTDLIGEAEIGAWELRAGCTNMFLYGINLTALMGGLLLAPHRVIMAFRDAKGARSLYVLEMPYEEIMKLSVAELREKLGVPEDGLGRYPARLHDFAPQPA